MIRAALLRASMSTALLVAPVHASQLAATPLAAAQAAMPDNARRLDLPAPWPALRLDDRHRWMEAVNRRVNKLPLSDCKAFAFEKQHRLRDRGIDSLFVSVRDEEGAHHAILVVDGVWALDSRFAGLMTVKRLRDFGYTIAPLRGEVAP